MEETLVETGLWDEVSSRLDQPAVRLSGGQQQRLCLARALALDPAVDEALHDFVERRKIDLPDAWY